MKTSIPAPLASNRALALAKPVSAIMGTLESLCCFSKDRMRVVEVTPSIMGMLRSIRMALNLVDIGDVEALRISLRELEREALYRFRASRPFVAME